MAITDKAKEYHEKMFGGKAPDLIATDPEFVERFASFAFDEVVNVPLVEGQEKLDGRTRFMAILSVLIGCQGLEEFRVMAPAALNMGLGPAQLKEIVYQAVAYLGMGRVYPFIKAVNEILIDRGIELPLKKQQTNTMETRIETGNQAQVEIFGEGMRGYQNAGPEETVHINRWLAGNCFGDYYTRKGLDLGERELITFCFIYAQGGCESQLAAHAMGNFNMGNDRLFLIQIISQCVPFIGYPRTLNALTVINSAWEQHEKQNG